MPKKSKLNQNFNLINEIKNELFNILEIDKDNNIFYLSDLDENIDIQNKIINLGKDCERFFAVSTLTYFKNKKNNKLNSRSYLTLLKNIFKICNIQYINKQTSYIENNKIKYVMKYIVLF